MLLPSCGNSPKGIDFDIDSIFIAQLNRECVLLVVSRVGKIKSLVYVLF